MEINPRISQSHSDLFEKVHGISHHEVMLNLALNRRLSKFDYKGDFNVAAHFIHRCFKSGIVRQIPTDKEIEDLKKKYPDLLIKINIKRDMDLEEMASHHIDSYSYVLAKLINLPSKSTIVKISLEKCFFIIKLCSDKLNGYIICRIKRMN